MKFISIIILTMLLSCGTKKSSDRIKDKSAKVETLVSDNSLIDTAEESNLNTEIIETFVDSLNIGEKGKSKIELIKHKVYEDNYIIIKFYTKGQKTWYVQNTYSYETNSMMGFEPNISDYNNDKFNDITFISGTAARGANEVRRLFIYDEKEQELISITNSQDYPNMLYNNELNCIDAFMVHGASTTVFAKIVADSLKTFASVDNTDDYHTIYLVDKNGNEKQLYKVKSKGVYIRHKNYKPLIEYKSE